MLHYGAHSSHLREAVADLALYLANGVVDWMSIRTLMANRLIALDKCPEVHPTGVGECSRRVPGHVMGLVTGWEAQSACGAEQCSLELRELFTLCLPSIVIILMMDGVSC